MVKIILLKRSSWICIHVDHLASSRLRCDEIKTVTQIDPILTRTAGSLRVSLVIEWRSLTYHGTFIICMSVLRTAFLLPANKVWGKVMFLHMSFILFRGVSVWCHFLSGYLVPCFFWRVSVPGSMFLLGVCLQQGLPTQGALPTQGVGHTPSGTKAADGVHPTGMLSCCYH